MTNALTAEKQISPHIQFCQRLMKSSSRQGSSHLQSLHGKMCILVKNTKTKLRKSAFSKPGALELRAEEKLRASQKDSQNIPYAVGESCTADSESQKAGKTPCWPNAEFRRGEWTESLKMSSLKEHKSTALPHLSNLISLMRLY